MLNDVRRISRVQSRRGKVEKLAFVGAEQLATRSVLVDDRHSNDAARRAVAMHSQIYARAHELKRSARSSHRVENRTHILNFLERHVRAPIHVEKRHQPRTAGAARREVLANGEAAQRHRVYLESLRSARSSRKCSYLAASLAIPAANEC